MGRTAYYRRYVGPWLRRRLTGTSSGDGRTAKFPEWIPIEPLDQSTTTGNERT